MACIYPYTFPGHITLPGCLSKQLVAWHIQYTPWCLEVPLLGQAVGVLDKIREQNLTSLAVIFVSSVFFMKEVQRKHYPILLHAHSCSDDILLHYHYHTTPLSILILLLIVISCFLVSNLQITKLDVELKHLFFSWTKIPSTLHRSEAHLEDHQHCHECLTKTRAPWITWITGQPVEMREMMVVKFGRKRGEEISMVRYPPNTNWCMQNACSMPNMTLWGGYFSKIFCWCFSQVPFSMLCMSFCFGAMSFHEFFSISSSFPELKRSE